MLLFSATLPEKFLDIAHQYVDNKAFKIDLVKKNDN